MTAAAAPAELLERAGLPAAEARAWAASAPDPRGSLGAVAGAVSRFLTAGQALVARLPAPARRSADEQAARDAVAAALDGARDSFLRWHAAGLYDTLTGGRTRSLRLEDLLAAAAARVPGLVPSAADLDAERARPLPEKDGIELAQGLLAAQVLAVPQAGQAPARRDAAPHARGPRAAG